MSVLYTFTFGSWQFLDIYILSLTSHVKWLFVSITQISISFWSMSQHGLSFICLITISKSCKIKIYSHSVIYKVYKCCYGQWLCRFDLCHQANDEEDEGDEEDNIVEQTLLENSKNSSSTDGHWVCCSFQSIHVGSHQKFVIAVWGI